MNRKLNYGLLLLLFAAKGFCAVYAAEPIKNAEDSLSIEQLQEVVVKGVRVKPNGPFATSGIDKQTLQDFSRSGKELPFLFARTPGVMAWSDNGVGTGTSYMRIRGAADSRINVTLDGVPLNSPEDQCVFWANMNSYGTLLGNVQIQRGIGTSTNGDGAFGGTVAMSSAAPSPVPSGEASISYGSYNTLNFGAKASTGILWDHLIIDGAYNQTSTDGYVHGTSGRSGSYYGGLTWLGNNFTIRYKNVGNFEKTGQAWNGVAADYDGNSIMDGTYGESTGIKTYRDMYNAGLGRYNTLYEHITGQNEDGSYTTERYYLNDGTPWPKTTDNFWQDHNLLTAAWHISPKWDATATLHYTYGYGYYEEFRPDNKLSKFGLTHEGLKRADFVRKKGLSQNTYGAVGSVNYKGESTEVIAGFSVQKFDGNHFGYLTYTSDNDLAREILADGDYQYYDSDADKFDANFYVKASYKISSGLEAFADLQYRHVDYNTDGINDKFISTENGYVNQTLDIHKHYNFFNPKAGLSYNNGPHSAYASIAIGNREPERNNFTDNGNYPAPKAERLHDYEMGYAYKGSIFHAALGLYYMNYHNQFVKTGLKSDIGEDLTTNIKSSYRLGMEASAGVKACSWLSFEGNIVLSRNRISDFDEVVEDWDNGTQTIHYDNSTLAFSPSCIANLFADFNWKRFTATLHLNSVSRQYLDNTENTDRSLPAYCVTNASAGYTLPLTKRFAGLREVVFGLQLNNLLNSHFATSGWVYSAIYESGGHTNDNRYYQIGFVPSAGFTATASITLRF